MQRARKPVTTTRGWSCSTGKCARLRRNVEEEEEEEKRDVYNLEVFRVELAIRAFLCAHTCAKQEEIKSCLVQRERG